MRPYGENFRPSKRLSDLLDPQRVDFEDRPQGGEVMPAPRQVDFQPRPMGGEEFNPFASAGVRATPFENRPMGGEMAFGPRQMDFQPRPQMVEQPGMPRQTGFQPRPQGGEAQAGIYGGPRGAGPYRMQDLLDLWWRR